MSSRHGSGSRASSHERFGAGALLAGALLSVLSLGNNPWDNVLERDETGEVGSWCAHPPDGWAGADGGHNARHWATNRSIWIFGDSFLGNTGGILDQEQWFVGNTLMTGVSNPAHTPTTSPGFYCRQGAVGTGWGTPANVTSVTTQPDKKPWMPAFPGDWGPTGSHFWWNQDAIVPVGTNNLISFWIPGHIKPDGFPGEDKHHKICKIDDVSGSAAVWANPTCQPVALNVYGVWLDALDYGFSWGMALMEDAGYIYIFGATREYPYLDGKYLDVVVARATPTTILDYGAWQFLWNDMTWKAQFPFGASDLAVVAQDAHNFFTVDKVTVNPGSGNVTRYVMVQTYLGGWPDDWAAEVDAIAVRMSLSSTFPPAWLPLPSPYNSDGSTYVKYVTPANGLDPACDGTPWNGNYAHLGQWDISDKGNRKLLVSYNCGRVLHDQETGHNVTPADLNGNTTCDDTGSAPLVRGGDPIGEPRSFGRIRFYSLDLMKLRPWCTSNCWMPP